MMLFEGVVQLGESFIVFRLLVRGLLGGFSSPRTALIFSVFLVTSPSFPFPFVRGQACSLFSYGIEVDRK